MAVIADYGSVLLVMACVFGFFMAWGVGANDVANAMGTSVGSKALTVRQAVIIAIIFEFAGAYFAGGSVTTTIRKGIVDPHLPEFIAHPELLIYGMLASLLAAGSWLLIATHYGWPVSTTHSIVGAIIGFAAIGINPHVVAWGKVTSIVSSWVISPLISGCFAFFLFVTIHKLILDTEYPFKNAKRFIPYYMFFEGFIIAMVTLQKGLTHVGLKHSVTNSLCISLIVGLVIMLLGKVALHKTIYNKKENQDFSFSSVEKIFGIMMIFTAAAMAFAHGSNDVANAVGPLAAIVSVIHTNGIINDSNYMPTWILFLGGAGIVVGLATWGYKVMATIGKRITELTPSRGFAAELSTATTVVFASGTGLPVSTTHTLVGAVLGVGLARGIAALNLSAIGAIFISWVITLPAGAILSILFYSFLKNLFVAGF